MAYLVLVRHGRSEYNDKGLWTGWTDVPLTPEGEKEALRTAQTLSDIKFDASFSSSQIRAKKTLQIILNNLELESIPREETDDLKEKNYGIYTGKNKWEVQKEAGEEEFLKIRRSWDYTIPEGESLKMVYERVVPFYQKYILPLVKKEKNVLVVASGNSLRALIKYLENIADDKIADLEIRTGEAYVYQMDNEGKIASKEIRAQNEKAV